MWKKIVLLLLALQYCSEISGRSIYQENHNEQAEPVNQQAYYTQQYGGVLEDLSTYIQKLQEQGLIQSIDHNNAQPFILENNANGYLYPLYPSYQISHQTVNGHDMSNVATDNDKGDYHNTHNYIPNISIDNNEKHKVNDNVSGHFGIENINGDDKKTTTTKNKAIVSHLNATIHKISDNIEHKVNAIKEYVAKSVEDINKLSDDVYQHVGNKTSRIFDAINKQLEQLEAHLHQGRIADEKLDLDEIAVIDSELDEDMPRSLLDDDDEDTSLTVSSEEAKKFPNLSQLDEEVRSDLKNSIFDTMKKTHEKFNKLIEDKVMAVNNKINAVNMKVESVFNKLYSTLDKLKFRKKPPTTDEVDEGNKKIYTPPAYGTTTQMPNAEVKYTTIQWKPKETPWQQPISHAIVEHVTPAYFQYTVPSANFFHNSFDLKANNNHAADVDDSSSTANLKRMDANVGNLEVTENNNIIKAVVVDILESNVSKLKGNEHKNATVDDLQTQIVDNVKDALKLDESVVVPEGSEVALDENSIVNEKTSNDENEQEIKSVETDEKQKIDEIESELVVEKNIEIDTTADHPDEPRNLLEGDGEFDDDDDEDEDIPANIHADYIKSSSDNGDDEDDNDAQDTEIHENVLTDSVDNDEKVSTDVPNHPSTDVQSPSNFDELAIIQLIPIIIAQLKQNNVTIKEQNSLEKIFGNSLWSLMTDEASRASDDDDMNPLLKTILNSEEVKLAKRDITEHFGNDIYKNSLRRVYRGSAEPKKSMKSRKPYISLDDDRKLLSPSERLLNMIAAIVHKSNVMEKSRQKAEREAKLKHKEKILRKRGKKSMGGNPLGIIKPRQRYVDRILSINRMKRSIIKFGTDLDDMRALLEQVNHDNDLSYDIDDEEHLAEADEYMDDDYDSFDIPEHEAKQNQLAYDSDYSFNSYPRHRNIFDDYENGSVNEFIHMARQRDRRENNLMDELLNDEQYDDGDDYGVYDDY